MKIKLTILFNLLLHLIGLVYLVLPNSVEHEALLAIKSEINYDPNQVLSSWNDSLHYCDWKGVICGSKHPKRVVGILLQSKGLGGILSNYVGNLSFLHYMSLYNNSFRGNIPPTLGHLFKLNFLSLESNSFEGLIPANISHCLSLKNLSLSQNYLSGTIPSQLSSLVNLQFLSLFENNLTGDLLNVIVKNMTFLDLLDASDNLLQGSIPQNIGEILPRLTLLDLSRNKLSGNIPNSFYNLSHLQIMSLSSNQLLGTLPLDIGIRLPQLIEFSVEHNFLQGNIPASLSNLTLLQIINVGFNNFTGKLKFSATNMPNLVIFLAQYNYLGTTGDGDLNFIQTFLNCSNLKYFVLRHNSFGGSLPDFRGNFSTKMVTLDLDYNEIEGSIPTWLFNMNNLKKLQLRGNHLTGQLSPQIEKLARLETLDLSFNNLTGRIPNSIGNLSYLSELDLSYNIFEGKISSNLGHCKNLLFLYLNNNNFFGPLSPLLFAPSSMIVELILEQNHLKGIIPTEIGQLDNLNVLSLSSNTFTGELPVSLSKCTSLDVLYLRGNFFIGSIPQSFESLASLSYIDLSYNNFSGPIPDYLIKFPLMALDLSCNNFVGEVPTRGVFANQSAFNIVGNKKLCGGIPQLHLPRCPPKFSNNGKKHRLSIAVILIIAVASLVVTVLILTVSYLIFVSRRQRRKSSQGSALSVGEPFSKLSYDMLSKATNGFSEENLLGIGHFGSVYKGVLDAESNMVVAVKVFQFQQRGAAKSFMVECEALRNTRHRNLLKICTVCSSIDFQGNDFKALVYEFMPNGNLHQWIHSNQQQSGLSLSQGLTIALDVACAVDYLHNDCEVPIIHCDLKPSNILLDADMVAHVGDFGLARFDSHSRTNNSSTITVKGTVGYSAPEYGVGMATSKEGDIYSFGIILIELMTAKSPIDAMFEGDLDLHKYAQSGLLSDELMNIIDPRLLNNCGSPRNDNMIIECIGSVMEMGVKCSAESPQNRMRIEDAISELKKTRDIWLKQLRLMDRYAWNLDA
ncbi:unnamed protein product [Amaranthus hypochondriacus]